jgi:hypothetical protein
MEVDEGSQVKSNKSKGALSPTTLDKLDSTVSPSPQVKSFKDVVTHSLDRGHVPWRTLISSTLWPIPCSLNELSLFSWNVRGMTIPGRSRLFKEFFKS